ncbi:hypothetical protein MRX96_046655 [Rhipicephalus microplus]
MEQVAVMTLGKIMGGTSSINSMNFVRGNKHDFNMWETHYNATGWNYTSVLENFKAIENFNISTVPEAERNEYHGKTGETPINYPAYNTSLSYAFLNACRDSGYDYIDYNGANHTDGEEMNVTIGYELILSAGAINSPKLLMVSGVGPKKGSECKQWLLTIPGAFEALLFTSSYNETIEKEKETDWADIEVELTDLFPRPDIEKSPYVSHELLVMACCSCGAITNASAAMTATRAHRFGNTMAGPSSSFWKASSARLVGDSMRVRPWNPPSGPRPLLDDYAEGRAASVSLTSQAEKEHMVMDIVETLALVTAAPTVSKVMEDVTGENLQVGELVMEASSGTTGKRA